MAKLSKPTFKIGKTIKILIALQYEKNLITMKPVSILRFKIFCNKKVNINFTTHQ